MHKEIKLHGKLSNGTVALVDPEDYETLKKHRWYLNTDGYALTNINTGTLRRKVRMHVLITNSEGKHYIDHINGNRLDNRKANLRPATKAENNRSRRIFRNNKSGFKGVCFRKGAYQAYIHQGDRQLWLGTFAHPILAAIAYNAAAQVLHREFAVLNVIPPDYMQVIAASMPENILTGNNHA